MYLRPPAYYKADDESFFFRENRKQSSRKYRLTSVIAKIRVHECCTATKGCATDVIRTSDWRHSRILRFHSTRLNSLSLITITHLRFLTKLHCRFIIFVIYVRRVTLHDITILSKREFSLCATVLFHTFNYSTETVNIYITNFRTKRSLLTRANETLQSARAISSHGL